MAKSKRVGSGAAEGGATRACSGRVTREVPEWPSGSRMLTVNGLGGGEDDGDPIFW
jgi:hypothetical protein